MLETSSIRILLVEGCGLVREGIRLILSNTYGFSVVAEAGSYADALVIANKEQLDIILLDLKVISDTGYGIIARILEAASTSRLIILTESFDLQVHRLVIDLGAKGLVMKQETSAALINAINKVNAGEISPGPLITERLINDLFKTPHGKDDDFETHNSSALTPREQQIVNLVSEGLRNKEIARILLITEATVSHHLTSIFGKLGVSGRLQLVIYTYRHGGKLISIPSDDDRPGI